jgi:hypothetical protein
VKHWWVNQNQTYEHEVKGGYLWSPKRRKDGGSNHFYDTMTQAEPGDIVFSFHDTYIKAVGVVTDRCESLPKPTEFGNAGANWNQDGWQLPVEFRELDQFIRPKNYIDRLLPTLPDKYSPLQDNGNGNQGVYLAFVPDAMAAVLRELLRGQVETIESRVVVDPVDVAAEQAAKTEEDRIRQDATLPATQRDQLIKARVGQGLFRKNVEKLEPACRLTGVTDRRMLRASHAKPWAQSTDFEKLDGANGLMLSPHVDHLFDKGLISFQDDGTLLVSRKLPVEILARWGLSAATAGKGFTPQQAVYLNYHRAHVFQS